MKLKMKISRTHVCFFILLLFSTAVSAQWSTNGTNVYYNGGNVGVGTSTPYNNGWNRIFNVEGSSAVLMASTTSGTYRGGVYAHPTFFGGGILMGTETNHKLILMANYDAKMVIDVTGNVGVGTLTPAYPMDIQGFGARVSNPSTTSAAYTTFRLQGPNYTSGLEIDFFGNNNISADPNWSYGGGAGSVAFVNTNAKPLTFGTNNLGRMLIDANGNVGIGTFSPDQKLTVKGTIHSMEVKVDLSVPGPDYVFEQSYKLPTLEQIERYIDTNKHLPEVPSAKEMEDNGLNVGEMNVLLLKKVEELTLYLIEMKKENELIKKRMEKIEEAEQK